VTASALTLFIDTCERSHVNGHIESKSASASASSACVLIVTFARRVGFPTETGARELRAQDEQKVG
jgi:hypothetical protein